MRIKTRLWWGWLGLALLLPVVALTANVTWAQEPEPPAILLPLTPMAPGSTLVVTSNRDIFAPQAPTSNIVVFPLANKQTESVKALYADARTISVLVPDKVASGLVDFRKDGVSIGTLNLTATSPQRDYLLITIFPVAFFLFFLAWLAFALGRDPNWSLGEALSEHHTEKVAVWDEANDRPLLDDKKEPVYYERNIYANSSSRLIAFIGLFVLATGILSVLIPAVYRFALTGDVPDMGNFSSYILAQAGIFAPYITNKVMDGFKSPAPNTTPAGKKRTPGEPRG